MTKSKSHIPPSKLGLGGGCHWCTEAVISSLKGISKLQSGWITPLEKGLGESEAVLVEFDPGIISLKVLLEIHLLTHASEADHSMRGKYRSAVYTFSKAQAKKCDRLLSELAQDNDLSLITNIYDFGAFRAVDKAYQDYYYSNPDRPFCQTYIDPKLKKIFASHRDQLSDDGIAAVQGMKS